MSAERSRRQILNLARPIAAKAALPSAAAPESTSLHPVRSYQVSLAASGGVLKVRLTSAVSSQVYDIDLQDAETKEHFLKLLEFAITGRGRMSLEIDSDNKVRTFVFTV
jgi:hypothetical protein